MFLFYLKTYAPANAFGGRYRLPFCVPGFRTRVKYLAFFTDHASLKIDLFSDFDRFFECYFEFSRNRRLFFNPREIDHHLVQDRGDEPAVNDVLITLMMFGKDVVSAQQSRFRMRETEP